MEAGSGPADVEFQLAEAWRRSAFPGTGGDGLPVPGDVITSRSSLLFGDGSATTLDLLVTSVDVANDWLYGIGLDPNRPAGDTTYTLISHTYPSTGNFIMFTDGCCRVGQTSIKWHVNNPDEAQRVETLVNVGGTNRSPVSALPPIVQCPIKGICSFKIPTSYPDGDPLRFRFSTPSEAGSGSFNQPGRPEAPNPATIDPTMGVYTWDTTGATLGPAGSNTLYSTQVTIEDLDAANAVKSKIAVDFLIQLVTSVGSPPVFNQPPTPACGSTINSAVGSTVAFTVEASDADTGHTVTVNGVGLPSGSTMTPRLLTTGNPLNRAFSWTPTAADTGTHVVTYTATDISGQQALITIVVAAQPLSADLSITRDDAPDAVIVGTAISYTLTVNNTGPDSATGVTLSNTLPAGMTYLSATPSQGGCGESAGTVTCSLGTMPSPGSASVVIQVTAPPTPGTITNTATVTGNEDDSNTVSNTDTDTTTVEPSNGPPDCSAVTAGPNRLSASQPQVPRGSAWRCHRSGWRPGDHYHHRRNPGRAAQQRWGREHLAGRQRRLKLQQRIPASGKKRAG